MVAFPVPVKAYDNKELEVIENILWLKYYKKQPVFLLFIILSALPHVVHNVAQLSCFRCFMVAVL